MCRQAFLKQLLFLKVSVARAVMTVGLSTLTSTEAAHCVSQSQNNPQWALPFDHAAPSTSQLCNQFLPLLMVYTASPSILAGQRLALWNQVRGGWWWGGGGWGKWEWRDVLAQWKHTYTHSANLWRSAVSGADCIAGLLSPLQIMSHHNRDKWCGLRTNEAASSSSPRGSEPGGRWCYLYQQHKHSLMGMSLQYHRGNVRG